MGAIDCAYSRLLMLAVSLALISYLAFPVPAPAKLKAFGGSGSMSYAISPARNGDNACGKTELIIANGHDHRPEYAARVATIPQYKTKCLPDSSTDSFSLSSLHFSDVATADFCGSLGHEPHDVAIFTSIAGPDGEFETGQLILAARSGEIMVDALEISNVGRRRLAKDDWQEFELDHGFAALSVAAADFDSDGHLDLAVGTAWPPPARTVTGNLPVKSGLPSHPVVSGQALLPLDGGLSQGALRRLVAPQLPAGMAYMSGEATRMRGYELLGGLRLYWGRHTSVANNCGIGFPSMDATNVLHGAVQLRTDDVAGDGRPDIIAAGRTIEIAFDLGTVRDAAWKAQARSLPYPKADNDAYFLDVDVLPMGRDDSLIAGAIAAFDGTAIAARRDRQAAFGVWLWHIHRTSNGFESDEPRFLDTGGVPGAVRFVDANWDGKVDLVVGRMTTWAVAGPCASQEIRPNLGTLGGAPLIVNDIANDFANDLANVRGALVGEAVASADFEEGGEAMMAIRVEPVAVDSTTTCQPIGDQELLARYSGSDVVTDAWFERMGARLASSFVPTTRFVTRPASTLNRSGVAVCWSHGAASFIVFANGGPGSNAVLSPPG